MNLGDKFKLCLLNKHVSHKIFEVNPDQVRHDRVAELDNRLAVRFEVVADNSIGLTHEHVVDLFLLAGYLVAFDYELAKLLLREVSVNDQHCSKNKYPHHLVYD